MVPLPTGQPPLGANGASPNRVNPDAVEQLIQSVKQSVAMTHPEIASLSDSAANKKMRPNPPEDDELEDPIERRAAKMEALYGGDFPLIAALREARSKGDMLFDAASLGQYTTADQWGTWTRGRWDAHRQMVATHIWLAERNRLFRAGQQWVSSKGRGPWREPPRQAETARIVHNLTDKALDQRLQVITDQRPGFEVLPNSLDPDEKRKASARQQALEFSYDAQVMQEQMHEAAYWAGTDGVAFWHVFWDVDAGPWDDRMADTLTQRKPLGDLRTETLRCEEVRVSSNATRTQAPYYAILRKVIPQSQAVRLYGDAAIQNEAQSSGDSGMGAGSQLYESGMPNWVMDITNPGESERMRNVPTVERFTMYIDPNADTLPEGLQIVVVGNAVVWGPDDLQFGVIPVIPVRDGSTDPSFYPRPIMEQWVDHQTQLNAAMSLIVNSIRVNASGRILARPNAISRETFVGGGVNIVEVEGSGPLSDQVLPLQGFSVGSDVKDFISLKIKAFEDASGYNDLSRGQLSGDASGRAILAAREQLERVFAPPVQATAMAFMKWAKVVLAGMAWGYDIPRDLGTVGKGRPDLARALTARDFEGPANVRVEEETLMPMPRAFRLFLLDNWFTKGLINAQQYLRRSEFALTNDISSPDEDQEARAKRIVDAIRMGIDPSLVPPMRWQDNEAIHQDVIEREILLQDDMNANVIAAANQRWTALANQAKQKAPQPPPPPAPGSPTAQYAQFQQKIASQATSAAEQLIAKAIEGADFVAPQPSPPPSPMPMPMGAPPQPMPGMSGPPAGPPSPMGGP